jgi:hypothetical protein
VQSGHGDGFFEQKTTTKGVSDWVVVAGIYIISCLIFEVPSSFIALIQL